VESEIAAVLEGRYGLKRCYELIRVRERADAQPVEPENPDGASVPSLAEVDAGAIERPLRKMKNAIYDRRANLNNLVRVEHLLTRWATPTSTGGRRPCAPTISRTDGAPLPRRQVDEPALRTR
jgi:hypothetical protein